MVYYSTFGAFNSGGVGRFNIRRGDYRGSSEHFEGRNGFGGLTRLRAGEGMAFCERVGGIAFGELVGLGVTF